jgi:hypothetical protein
MDMNKDYIYLRARDKMMLSGAYWTEIQLERARRHKAPADAIYWDERGRRWHRFSEVTNQDTKILIERMIVEPHNYGI